MDSEKGRIDETRLLFLIMVSAAVLGAVMSSTAIVAIFIPIVLQIADRTSLQSSRMLMPMSYEALISGMMTLIATPPNLVVHEELKAAGFEGFGFFGFTLVGAGILVIAILYVLSVGRKTLSSEAGKLKNAGNRRTIFFLWEDYRVGEDLANVQIPTRSSLAGQSIADTKLDSRYKVRIHGIVRRGLRGEERIASP
jgi:di/tricarboxylate transporter